MFKLFVMGAIVRISSLAPAPAPDAPDVAPAQPSPFEATTEARAPASQDQVQALDLESTPPVEATPAARGAGADDADLVEWEAAAPMSVQGNARVGGMQTEIAQDEKRSGQTDADPPSGPSMGSQTGTGFSDRTVKPDRAIDWRIELMPAAGTSYMPHASYGLFDLENRQINHMGVELRVDRKLAGPVFLGGGLGYRYLGSQAPDLFGDDESEIDIHELRGLMRVSYVPLEGVDIYALGGVGPSFVDYVVSYDAFASGKGVGVNVDAMGGVVLSLPKRWMPNRGASRFTVGLDLGLGYTFRSKIEIKPSYELDDEPLAHDFPSLGDLRMSSLTWRAGLVLRFM